MTRHAKMLCSLAITATALVTFSLSSNEAFARSGVMRRVAVTHAAQPVKRIGPFVRGKLNPYAARSLRKTSLNRQHAILTEGKGHGHDGGKDHGHHEKGKDDWGHKEAGKDHRGDKDKGHRGDKEHGDKDKDHRGDKEHGDKDKGHRGDKEHGDKDKGHRGDKEHGDKDKGHRGDKDYSDKDKGGDKQRPMGGQAGNGFPDLGGMGSGGGSGGQSPSPVSSPSPADAGSSGPASTTSGDTVDPASCTSHHSWRNGQRVLIKVCPDV